jgi:hypothetical protein
MKKNSYIGPFMAGRNPNRPHKDTGEQRRRKRQRRLPT